MPSTRSANFVDADVLEAELVPTGTERALPPASVELRAPSAVAERSDARRRREHPARIGRPTKEHEAQTVHEVFEGMRKGLDIPAIAANAECGQDGRKVREVVAAAKETLQRRIGEYVEIHLVAAKVAAMKGDARPAEWALENIAVEGERVVDPPQKNLPPAAPTFNLGFVIGGMPQRPQIPANTEK